LRGNEALCEPFFVHSAGVEGLALQIGEEVELGDTHGDVGDEVFATVIGHVAFDVVDRVLVDLRLLRRGHVAVGGAAGPDEGLDRSDERALQVEHSFARFDDESGQTDSGLRCDLHVGDLNPAQLERTRICRADRALSPGCCERAIDDALTRISYGERIGLWASSLRQSSSWRLPG